MVSRKATPSRGTWHGIPPSAMRRQTFTVVTCFAVAFCLACTGTATAQSGRKATIAVLPFELAGSVVNTGATCDTTVLQDVFNRVLVNSRKFVVVDRARLKRLRAEQRFGTSGPVDPGSRARVGRDRKSVV